MPRYVTINGTRHRISYNETPLQNDIIDSLDSLEDTMPFNPLVEGVAADGVTNDSVAFAAALATATAAEQVFYLPAGTYMLANVSVPANSIIRGVSRDLVTLKMPAQASGTGGSILVLAGNNIVIEGVTFDGNKSNQPADGFQDSWNSGVNGVGRSYRAAIVAQSRTGVTVRDCYINNCYGAGLACRDTSKVTFTNNTCTGNYFEPCYIYATNVATRNSGHIIKDNRIYNTGSGHASVNGNAALLSSSDDFVFDSNLIDTVERNGVKTENCKRFSITNNKISNVSVLNFSGIQLQSGSEDAVVSGNSIYIAGGGVAINQQATSQVVSNITVSNNTADACTNTDGTAGGALSVSATYDGATLIAVNENTVRGHYKHSFQFVGQFDRLECNGNRSYGNGDANSNGIRFSASTGNWTGLSVFGNIFENSAGSNGQQMRFERSSSYTITGALIIGNLCRLTGGPATIHCTVNDFISGIFALNYGIGGVIQFNQKDCLTALNACSLNSDSALQMSGQFKTITGTSATLTHLDSLVFTNCSTSSAVTLTLPSGAVTGQVLTIKDIKGDAASNNVTISGTIDGAAGLVINSNYGVKRVVYTGSAWVTL